MSKPIHAVTLLFLLILTLPALAERKFISFPNGIYADGQGDTANLTFVSVSTDNRLANGIIAVATISDSSNSSAIPNGDALVHLVSDAEGNVTISQILARQGSNVFYLGNDKPEVSFDGMWASYTYLDDAFDFYVAAANTATGEQIELCGPGANLGPAKILIEAGEYFFACPYSVQDFQTQHHFDAYDSSGTLLGEILQTGSPVTATDGGPDFTVAGFNDFQSINTTEKTGLLLLTTTPFERCLLEVDLNVSAPDESELSGFCGHDPDVPKRLFGDLGDPVEAWSTAAIEIFNGATGDRELALTEEGLPPPDPGTPNFITPLDEDELFCANPYDAAFSKNRVVAACQLPGNNFGGADVTVTEMEMQKFLRRLNGGITLVDDSIVPCDANKVVMNAQSESAAVFCVDFPESTWFLELAPEQSSDSKLQINLPPVADFEVACVGPSCNFINTSTDDGEDDLQPFFTISYLDAGDSRLLQRNTQVTGYLNFPETSTAVVKLCVPDLGGLVDCIQKNIDIPAGSGEPPWLYNGMPPNDIFGIEENNIGFFDSGSGKIYSCLAVKNNGQPALLNGIGQYGVAFNILSVEQALIQLDQARVFNESGLLIGNSEAPYCSGTFELSDGTYTDRITVGGEVFRVEGFLSDGVNLKIQLTVAEPLARGRRITGSIRDHNGDPLIGANILVAGTSRGTISDLNGEYDISVPPGATSLEISYTGFQPLQADLGSEDVVDVMLQLQE